jgi:hypothetical protein
MAGAQGEAGEGVTMNAAAHAERIARLQAERVAVGRSPTIQSEAVYRLLAAVIDANRKHAAPPTK